MNIHIYFQLTKCSLLHTFESTDINLQRERGGLLQIQ